ncbi:ABC transporter permease subunit [Corynebacterium sp.]|uniref:ABC transporter permease subunit n=1 Tax=Corynebacterium sp. TaxID=1720 RepID=UPI0026DBA688|nr:ABC transporter permease subunit [Corynebacterium sp.]MDO4609792.1 ABC transporter permease subunit [Corynebacterium sp.]
MTDGTSTPVPSAGTAAAASSAAATSAPRRTRRRPRIGVVLLAVVWAVALAAALAGPAVAGLLGLPDPGEPLTRPFAEPSTAHLLGGDRLGRDVLARLLSGNTALVVPPAIAATCATGLGLVIALAGEALPRLGRMLHLAADAVLVIPGMILVLAAVTAAPGAVAPLLAVSVLIAAPLSARYLAAASRPVLASGFVESARVAGEPAWRILLLDVLPALRRPIAADLGLRYVALVFVTATAAFLGASTGGGDVTWPAMAQAGMEGLKLNPWAAAAPCLAVTLLAAPPALLADALLGGRR